MTKAKAEPEIAVPPPQPPKTAYVSFSAEINAQTAESLLGLCANLANQGTDVLYLLLSTPGGQVMYGMTIYNMLRGMPFKLITHNVGNVDSIGNPIFLAGEERYACPNSTFMFHGVGFDASGGGRFEEKLLLERLGSIQADQKRIGDVIAERSTLKTEEVQKLFLQAVTRDPDYALANGIVHEIRNVAIPRGATIHQLVFKR
jgi:ATP-dependent protease ClpP protease subunit